jgi:ATP-dependent DNA helicase RecQ
LPALVFCRSRKRVEGVARELAATLGWERVGAYHAGLTKDERTAIEQWFFSATDAVLVATCAYGMGVDKSNIRTTIHYDLPGNVEAFLQESGRAGRDGEPAQSIVLFGHDDLDRHGIEADPGRRARYEQLIGYCRTAGCRRDYLLGLLGANLEACFGCDHCSPDSLKAVTCAAGEVEAAAQAVISFVRSNRRLLTAAQVVRLLCWGGTAADRSAAARLRPPAGGTRASFALSVWGERELDELVAALVGTGVLQRAPWPWKGRLTTGRRKAARAGGQREHGPAHPTVSRETTARIRGPGTDGGAGG